MRTITNHKVTKGSKDTVGNPSLNGTTKTAFEARLNPFQSDVSTHKPDVSNKCAEEPLLHGDFPLNLEPHNRSAPKGKSAGSGDRTLIENSQELRVANRKLEEGGKKGRVHRGGFKTRQRRA